MVYGKLTMVIIYITIAVVVLTGVYYAFSGKDARQIYFEVEAKNFKKFSNNLRIAYENFINNQKPYMSNKYNNKTTIYINMENEAENFFKEIIPVPFDIAGIINRCSLVYDLNCEPLAALATADISLMLEKTPLIEAKIFTVDDLREILIPGLFPNTLFKYNENERSQISKSLDIPFIPTVIRIPEIAQTIYFNPHDFDKTMLEYGRLMSSIIQRKDVTIIEEIRVKIGDKEINGREIVIKLNAAKTRELIEGIRQRLLKEDTIYKITFGNILNIYDFIGEKEFNITNLMEDVVEISDVDIKNEIKKMLEQDIKQVEFMEGMTMNLITDNSKNIIERKINIPFKYKTGEYLLQYHIAKNSITGNMTSNSKHTLIFMKSGNESQRPWSKFILNNIAEESEKVNIKRRRVKILYDQYEGETAEVSLNADLYIEKDCGNNDGIQKTNTSCRFEFTSHNSEIQKQSIIKIPLTIHMESIKTPKTGDLKIPKAEEYKIIDIGKLSKIEFEEIIQEALKNLGIFIFKAFNLCILSMPWNFS